MKVHEYQAKELFKQYGIPVPRGKVAETPEEAKKIAEELGGNLFVVKAQVHAGGRGKAGGVKLARSVDEVYEIAKNMIGMKLVTHQTGPEGKLVRKVLVEEGLNIEKEFYVGMVIDRQTECPVIMVSSEGGVEIEEVAKRSPEKILKAFVDPALGMMPFYARKLAFGLGFTGDVLKKAVNFITALYKLFIEKDASLAEINPLVLTKEGDLIALDAKINFDDNALYRHPEIAELRDIYEEDPLEVEASKYDLNYIKLDGNIGCMVNGAGLAMATMDIIKLYGGEPANFLDVGGAANADRVKAAFKILLSDPNVKAVFINIFGGIVRCDRVAEGVTKAARELEVKVPMVVRLEGTNKDEAMEILKNSGLSFILADSMADGAEKAVKAAKGEL
ncbi:succinyl-CoA synthetase beta subunit [Thermosulfidibacter takaii ABI70S6]|uniref:Succinate--CoA ligase [ADP-forming] subunit beta n=1 Tax=Thermosulfidibacter takaii (strain DSM 17441 / JCM 13301 / NBRC 103674 / ABI70S6) TaxID=1298851 RepID=A0A0S3QTE2_THET7|nr:ADP-forming succinate--CoA ligase subunit beta [Thermosulfidibacter takaii]BAT71591.1 succinyl-CoA synthetase beta subunit [Thermosulfidibacter takaii ABI70S6]